MGRREITAAFLTALFAGGVAAVIGATALPPHSPYFDVLIIVGGIAIVVGAIGLLVMWITAKTKDAPSSPAESRPQGSTFIKAGEGSSIEIEDSFSSADTFADVTDSKVSSRRNRHEPGSGAKAPDNPA